MTDETPVTDAASDDAPAASRARYGWFSAVIAVLFGLFYAYELWVAVSNLVALPGFYDDIGFGSQNVPWWLLWIGVLIPAIVFLLALLIGRRQNVLAKALIFFVGLAVVAGLGLGVSALEDVLRPVLIPISG